MLQITYISSASPPMAAGMIDDILAVSRRNNQRAGVTGVLVHDGRRFLQVLEGEPDAVWQTIDRIRADQRHRAIVMLNERTVASAEFGPWAMAGNAVRDGGPSATLAEAVDRLVAGVSDPNTRALFSSFARIDRRAA